MQRRRGSLATALSVAIATALSVMVVGALPAAAAPTYTWTGTDAAASTPNKNWSDPNNWSGGVAPLPNTTVNLVFPVLTCGTQSDGSDIECRKSTNDVAAVTVDSLTIDEAPPVGLHVTGYDIGGNSVTLNGLSVSSNGSTLSLVTADLRMPITLGGNATWTVSNGGYISIDGAVTGSNNLAVTLVGGSWLVIGGSVNVGPATITGLDPNLVQRNGEFAVSKFGSFNTISGQPVTVTKVGMFGAGSFGPLTTSGTVFQTGDGGAPRTTTPRSPP